jgi:pimeloyl-ACP methyl ester carboxylesterase
MPEVRIPAGTIYFREKGSGEPLVLLMGTGADHSSWARQVPDLGRRFRVITPDNRGSGKSVPPPQPDATTGSIARETLDFLNAIGVGRFHVAGYSLGAAIAMEVALLEPERVISSSFHAGWAGPNPDTDDALARSLEVASTRGAAAFLEAACRRNFSPAFQRSAAFEPFLENVLSSTSQPTKEGIVAQTRAGLSHDVRGRLPTLAVPSLVTTGEHDPVAPPRVAQEVARLIPNSRLHIFRGDRAWHAIPLEMASEFNRLLLEFHGELAGSDPIA